MDTTADGKPSKPGKGTNGKAGTSGGLSRWAALMYNKPMRDDGFRRVQGVDVTVEWLDADPDALKEPVVIETPEGLGMKMPDEEFTVQDVADAVGEDHPVEVIGMYLLVITTDLELYILTAVICRCGLPIQQPRLDGRKMGHLLQHTRLRAGPDP
jgi:hypothetical protein